MAIANARQTMQDVSANMVGMSAFAGINSGDMRTANEHDSSHHVSSTENIKSKLASMKSNPPSTGIPFTKFFSDTFPLPLADSYEQWTNRTKLDQAELEVLSALPFYPEPDATRRARNVQVDVGNGNWLNEFEIERTVASEETTNDLVVVHGYGAGLGFFYQNFDALSSVPGWRVHALDWLGYGRSARPKFKIHAEDPYDRIRETESFFIDSLEAWRKARGLERFTLVAHSVGAYLSFAYSLKYPGHLKKLVLVSPAGVPRSPFSISAKEKARQKLKEATGGSIEVPKTSVEIPAWFNYLWEQNVSPFFLVRGTGPLGPRVVSGWTSRRFANLPKREAKALHRYVYSIFNAPGSGEYALNYLLAPGAHARWPLAERVKDVNCETVWIYGQDDWMDLDGGVEAVEEIRRAKGTVPPMHIVESAGHHVFMDNVDEFNRLIIDVMHEVEEKP